MRAALALMPTSSAPEAAPVATSASASSGSDEARPGRVVAAAKAAHATATARAPKRSTAGPATSSIAGREPTATKRSATPSPAFDAPVASCTLGSTAAHAPQKRPSATKPASVGRRCGVTRLVSCCVDVSIVVTVLNEERTVPELYSRLAGALDGREWEAIFVDDGSTDATFARLRELHARDPHVRAVRLKRNYGQHPAMHAGLVRARGRAIVTMDGDLQNEPEDIPKLVAALEHVDVASGRRAARHDSVARTMPSRVINTLLRRFTGVPISDFGCAFNAYRREAIEPLLGSIGKQKFTKALVLRSGATVEEVDVSHAPARGGSRYSPFRLVRLALHVIAGFWPQPVQWIGVALGLVCTLAAAALGTYGIVFWVTRGNFPGPLFAGTGIVFVLGMEGFILALIGEYLGRIQRDVEGMPLYTVA